MEFLDIQDCIISFMYFPITNDLFQIMILDFFIGWQQKPCKYDLFSPFQQQHNWVGCVCVKTSGWFIQKQDWRGDDQFHPYVGSLSLSTRDPSDKLISHLSIEYFIVIAWYRLLKCWWKKKYTSFWIVLTNHGANELQCYIFSMFKSFLKVYLLINRNVVSDLPLCQYSVRVLALLSLCLLSHFSPLKIRMREDAEMQRTGNFPARSKFPWQYHPAIPTQQFHTAISTQHNIIIQYQHYSAVSTRDNNIFQYWHNTPSSLQHEHNTTLSYDINTTPSCNIKTIFYLRIQISFSWSLFQWYLV